MCVFSVLGTCILLTDRPHFCSAKEQHSIWAAVMLDNYYKIIDLSVSVCACAVCMYTWSCMVFSNFKQDRTASAILTNSNWQPVAVHCVLHFHLARYQTNLLTPVTSPVKYKPPQITKHVLHSARLWLNGLLLLCFSLGWRLRCLPWELTGVSGTIWIKIQEAHSVSQREDPFKKKQNEQAEIHPKEENLKGWQMWQHYADSV